VGFAWDEGDFSESALNESLSRQMTLERLGWEYIRIRASEYHLNPEKTLKGIIRQLKKSDIHPERTSTEPESNSNELHERVVKRAELIRNRWKDIPKASSIRRTRPRKRKAG